MVCLANAKLWMAKPQDLNDPYEVMRYIDESSLDVPEAIRREALEQIGEFENKEAHVGALRKTLLALNDHFPKLGVCCFSEDPESHLMWSHYAAAHTGYVLEFEINPALVGDFVKVPYEDEPTFDPFSIGNDFTEAAFQDFARRVWSIKKTEWSYEREWRWLVPFPKECPHLKRYRDYPGELLSVRFGPRMDVATKYALFRIVMSTRRKPPTFKNLVFKSGTYQWQMTEWPNDLGLGPMKDE